MKKVNSLVITTILSFFLYFSFFCSFPVSSASYFFLTTPNKKKIKKKIKKNKKNKKVNQNINQNIKINDKRLKHIKKKEVNQNRKINDKRLKQIKKSDKKNNNQKYSFLDNDGNRLFLFLFIVFLVIFILCVFFPVVIKKFKKKEKEEDKKTKINRIANQLLSKIVGEVFNEKNVTGTIDNDAGEKKIISLDFFSYECLLSGLNDLEIINNFLNFAFEESFKRLSDNVNDRGLNFTEIIEKIEEDDEEKLEVEFFYRKDDFLDYINNINNKGKNKNKKLYFFIYEDFIKAFFNFFTIGYRLEKEVRERVGEDEILKKNKEGMPFNNGIIVINNIIMHIFSNNYSHKIKFKEPILKKDNDFFSCTFWFYEHQYSGGDEKNFREEYCERLPEEDSSCLRDYEKYALDRDSLRSLGRRKRNGQNINFKNFKAASGKKSVFLRDLEKPSVMMKQLKNENDKNAEQEKLQENNKMSEKENNNNISNKNEDVVMESTEIG